MLQGKSRNKNYNNIKQQSTADNTQKGNSR